MTKRSRGLYEVLVTECLDAELRALDESLVPQREAPHPEEVADRVALHVSGLIERELRMVKPNERIAESARSARAVLDVLYAQLPRSRADDERPIASGELLRAISQRQPNGAPEVIAAPLTPLLDTTLLTNSPGEPRVGQQILTEIASADRIDLVMAFVRLSGVRPMIDALRRHCQAGRSLRVLDNLVNWVIV